MIANQKRLQREKKTIRAMIELYCQEQHHPQQGLCPDCTQLSSYALQRIEKCPYGSAKPTCASCPIHCYQPAMRQQVRVVMRFAGPRMLLRHPVLALLHMWDGKVNAPDTKKKSEITSPPSPSL